MTAVNRRTKAWGRPEQLVGALVPPLAPQPRPVPASLAVLPPRRLPTGPNVLAVDMGRLDRSGRLSARPLLRALGWGPGHRVDIDSVDGVLVIMAAPAGRHVVTLRGELVVPGAIRRLCGIAPRSPVVLAAYPRLGLVVVHPAGVVARLLHGLHSRLAGADHAG